MHDAGDDVGRAAAPMDTTAKQPSRRSLLAGGATVLSAGTAVTLTARAASVEADAELIAACEELVRIDTACRVLAGYRGELIERERQTEVEFQRLNDSRNQAKERVYDAGEITTYSGALALARAAVALAPLQWDGSFMLTDDAEILGFDVLEFLVGSTPSDRLKRDL